MSTREGDPTGWSTVLITALSNYKINNIRPLYVNYMIHNTDLRMLLSESNEAAY
jgi:hypothetical protein